MSTGLMRQALTVAGAPIDALAGGAQPGDVVVLIYHRVGERSPSPVDLAVATFDRQLDVLEGTGLVVELADALTHLDQPRLGDDDVRYVITFDDGTADWVDVVAPVLVDREVPATFYVATDFVEQQRSFPDDGRPISWAGLRDLHATGLATIGSHTHTHRILSGADAAETADELDRSIGLLEDHLGTRCRHFAYPNAVRGSAAAETVVRRRTDSAVLAGNRPNRPGRTDPHRLGRHALTVADDDARFERKTAGGARLEGWVRERRDALRASGTSASRASATQSLLIR